MKYRMDIDGLRAVAVTLVLLDHAGIPGFSGGFVGVDVFFVISGFLITTLLVQEPEHNLSGLVNFYERRVRRILPALLAMLLFCLLAGFWLLSPGDYETLGEGTVVTLFFSSNVWLWAISTDYFGLAAEMNFLLHTWSLAVEEHFYLIYPFLLWWSLQRGEVFAFGMVALLGLVSFVAWAVVGQWAKEAAFFLSPFRFWELAIGGALSLALARTGCTARNAGAAILVGLAGLGLIFMPLLVYRGDGGPAQLASMLAAFGSAALIWAGAAGNGPASRLLSLRPIVWVGLISYSLYLWHWPILVALRHAQGAVQLSFAMTCVAIAASVAIATLSWRFVEQPFRRRGAQGFSRGRIFRFAGLASAVLLAFGITLNRTEGLPVRMSPEAREIFRMTAAEPSTMACEAQPLSTDRCRTGPNPADVLLWGDSHAGAIWPGVMAAVAQKGMVAELIWDGGCPPLLGIERTGTDGAICREMNDNVMSALRQRDDLGTVILAARWALSTEGLRAPGEPGINVLLRDITMPDLPPTLTNNRVMVERGLERTVEALRATGRRVVIVGNIPEIGWSPPEQLAWAVEKGREMPTPPDLDTVRRRSARARAVIEALARDHGVTVIDVEAALCTPMCVVAEGNLPYYRDDDHLNRFGATRFIAPLLAPIL